jgi:GAF domain-containing protein
MVNYSNAVDPLAQAQATIATQAEEIRRLQQQVRDNRFADELRQTLEVAGAAGVIIAPQAHTQLITLILEMASRVVSSATASISLVDEQSRELEIRHAVGPGAEAAQGLRFPLGHGIAGLVAASGQPMAVSGARSDARHAGEIAAQTGYQPDAILCVPLVDDEQVIGVMQVMDKAGGLPFTTSDIETLGMFAEQATIVVQQARINADLTALVGRMLASPSGESGDVVAEIAGRAFAGAVQTEADYQGMLELAQLVQRIAGAGERERHLCAALLRSTLTYVAGRPQLNPPGRIG